MEFIKEWVNPLWSYHNSFYKIILYTLNPFILQSAAYYQKNEISIRLIYLQSTPETSKKLEGSTDFHSLE